MIIYKGMTIRDHSVYTRNQLQPALLQCNAVPTRVCAYTDWALSGTKNLTPIDIQKQKLTVKTHIL